MFVAHSALVVTIGILPNLGTEKRSQGPKVLPALLQRQYPSVAWCSICYTGSHNFTVVELAGHNTGITFRL